MTIPYIFSMSVTFMPVVIQHMWFVLFLAALYRSNYLTNTKLTILAGIFLAFTLLARPIESAVILIPALVLYFYYLHREKRVQNFLRLILSLILAGVPVLVCSLGSMYGFQYTICWSSVFAVTLFLMVLVKNTSNSLIKFSNGVLLLIQIMYSTQE